ncbi:MAG TPA: hypothetical protein VMT00_12505 [Thermoanaerobaculia bacterium]|nr:hypothetical protein [Thermoanaerobaculia bacterium]
MGIVAWLAAAGLAIVVARMLPQLRPSGWKGETAVATVIALLAGLVATALDFGGLDEIDPRAVAFAAACAFGSIALVRMAVAWRAGSHR